MKSRKLKLNAAQQRWLRDWWRALQPKGEDDPRLPGELLAMGRGERARLRRCRNADELLGDAATLLLADRLVVLNEKSGALPDVASSYERIAWVAGVLATVKDDKRDDKSLAWHLGSAPKNDRAKMSDLRFKVLQRSRKIEDLFSHWRRAVKLADCSVDVVRLADDLLSWQIEMGQSTLRASDGVKFHWAYDFYLNPRERAASEEPESIKEII